LEARHYFYATNTASDTIVVPDGALSLTATVHGLPAYDGSNGMEGIVATGALVRRRLIGPADCDPLC
jgi:hypothetical protein